MKYKIGDNVKVKSIEWYNANKNKYGTVKCSEVYFQPTMSRLCGNILTIKNIDKIVNAYIVEENSYYWVDDMFEENVEETFLKGGFDLWENKINGILFSNENYVDKVELCLGDDYEIVVEDGRTFVQKKKPKYPKTYEECCGVLGMTFDYPDIRRVSSKEHYLYSSFFELIRCRDAYWKIAGEQMGLDKPWMLDLNSDAGYFYTIKYNGTHIRLYNYTQKYAILAFPTKEMRDAFYENLKELIENCKELL